MGKKWIFISHSHYDIDKARIVRNYFEELNENFEPLLFYLKCLDDDSEIEDLIKREIDARNIYIYLDSEHARKSKWVRSEKEYIEKKYGKVNLMTVNVEQLDMQDQLTKKRFEAARIVMSDIFLSYSQKDITYARKISEELNKIGFTVKLDLDIIAGESFLNAIENMIASSHIFFALITENTIKSRAQIIEIEYYLNNNYKKDNKIFIPLIISSQGLILWQELVKKVNGLKYIQAVFINPDNFHTDLITLLESLVEIVSSY